MTNDRPIWLPRELRTRTQCFKTGGSAMATTLQINAPTSADVECDFMLR